MKFNKNFESWHTGCLIILVCKKNRKRNCGQLEKNWPNTLGKTQSQVYQDKKKIGQTCYGNQKTGQTHCGKQ